MNTNTNNVPNPKKNSSLILPNNSNKNSNKTKPNSKPNNTIERIKTEPVAVEMAEPLEERIVQPKIQRSQLMQSQLMQNYN